MTEPTIALSELEWESGRGVHVVGKAFLEDELHETDDLYDAFCSVSSYDQFRTLVSDLNGQFAVIVIHKNGLWAGVDHIRTHPLFYATVNGEVYVGDDFPAINDALEHKPPDRVSAMEFVAAGYPTGPHTLHPDVKKMRAGEIVSIGTSDFRPEIRTEEYFRYRQNPEPVHDEEKLLESMDRALANAFERTIEVADGRPIVLPLSGGYDSRLIGLLLREQGYEDVYTFCHNREEDVDIEISEEVAADLGYNWFEVNYSDQELQEFRGTEEWQDLHQDIGNYGTLQPSPRHLLNFRKVEEKTGQRTNAVYVQGHHAAAPGEFMPSFFDSVNRLTRDTVLYTIYDYHFDNCLWNRRRHRPKFDPRVLDELPATQFDRYEQAIDAIEYWYWRERTPNRLLPNPIIFDRYGYRGWYPLWDKEFAQVFSKIPVKKRLNKSLYKKYVKRKYREVCGSWRSTDKEIVEEKVSRKVEREIGRLLVGSRAENTGRVVRNLIRSYVGENEKCGFRQIWPKKQSNLSYDEIESVADLSRKIIQKSYRNGQ